MLIDMARRKSSNDFGFDLDIPTLDIPSLGEREKVNPNKLGKDQLVRIIAGRVSWKKIYEGLVSLGKREMAEQLKIEAVAIENKYQTQKSAVKGTAVETTSNVYIDRFIQDIISNLKRVYSSFDETNIKEVDFQRSMKLFLDGATANLQNQLNPFGIIVQVEKEKVLQSGERIDFMISIGNFRIGLEMKTELSTSYSQRLLGQIDRYIDSCDALLVFMITDIIDSITMTKIKEKASEKNKTIKIITPTKVL